MMDFLVGALCTLSYEGVVFPHLNLFTEASTQNLHLMRVRRLLGHSSNVGIQLRHLRILLS